MSTKEPTPRPWISEYLIPIGSILIAALALLAQYGLPTWIIVIAVLYLIIVAIVSLYTPVTRLLSSLVNEWRLRRLAKTCFPQLLESMRKFRELVASQNANTLLYVLQQAAQWDEQKGKSLLPDPEYIETIRAWLFSLEKRAERYRRGNFLGLCIELSSLIHQYNRFCSQRLKRLEELVAAKGVAEQQLRQLTAVFR